MFIVPMCYSTPSPVRGDTNMPPPRGLVKFSLPLTINLSLLRG